MYLALIIVSLTLEILTHNLLSIIHSQMKKIALFTFLLISLNSFAQLKFNEIMSNNVSAVMDDAYNYSMWVEIYNPGKTKSYNQSNYFITDKRSEPTKWHPTSKLIAPGGFGLLWFERDDRVGHASFKLDPDGGKLFMFDANLQVVDSVFYPAQYRNISYGRLTNESNDWVYFDEHSAGASNNGKKNSFLRCGKPVFKIPGGFYPTGKNVSFETPAAGDTIYYTLTNVEPTKQNGIRYVPGYVISIRSTSCVRAKCISAKKLSSDVVTSTFFIGERDFNLPVVSIVTNQANLTDNTIGIYCDGTNGITGNGQSSPRNYNQDWDRAVNLELYDTAGVARLNQEVDINILGAWTRANPQKSIGFQPKKKFGLNTLEYDVFGATKPNHKYKDIQMRNSGNDFYYSMLRDGFMQSIVMKRFDLDCLAYEPAICFMNGVYFGIQNLREKASSDYMYSNYGLDDSEVTWIEATNTGIDTERDIATDPGFTSLSNYLKNNDVTKPTIYSQICTMIDVDEFANYMMSEIFYGNYDWPNNNVKMWKKTVGGKWRWIVNDTDFGFNLYNTSLQNHNTLTFALGENSESIIGGSSTLPDWSTVILRRLILNDTFRNKFIDRYCIHLSTTFATSRVNSILDSVSSKIATEITYHKAKYGSSRDFASDIATMKTFSAARPDNMLGFLSARFLSSAAVQTIALSANVAGASYKLNSEPIIDSNVLLKYFNSRNVALEARQVTGYKFKQWELAATTTSTTLIPMGSTWKYNDGSTVPATNWNATTYSDAAWKSGTAQLGYGGKGEVTTIGYGGVSTNKYTAAYFRKTISITDVAHKTNVQITAFIDDGAAIYVNGTEIGRSNLPTGTLTFASLASTVNNGITVTFPVPSNLLKEGDNVIAVEVHQSAIASSDLIFNLQMTCDNSPSPTIVTTPVYTTTLTKNLQLKAIYEVSSENNDQPTVAINEVLSGNTLIPDEFGSMDDYIELYNYGTKAVNIAGWYLTDMPINRTLVQFPTTDSIQTTIPAKGRVIIWADDQPSQGALHVGLKLSKDGETLILSKKNLQDEIQLVDSVSFPALNTNLTYSRVPDGSDIWLIQPTTYNLTNGLVDALQTPTTSAQVYPTFVHETLTVTNAEGLRTSITDLTGKVLLQQTIRSENEKIQIGQLQRGIYIVSVGNTNFKIVKF